MINFRYKLLFFRFFFIIIIYVSFIYAPVLFWPGLCETFCCCCSSVVDFFFYPWSGDEFQTILPQNLKKQENHKTCCDIQLQTQPKINMNFKSNNLFEKLKLMGIFRFRFFIFQHGNNEKEINNHNFENDNTGFDMIIK